MSYFSLYYQLSIEFLADPDFDKSAARDDLSIIWLNWRKSDGRHLPIEQLSAQFNNWWQHHYRSCLPETGCERRYRAFIEALDSKLRFGSHLNNTEPIR